MNLLPTSRRFIALGAVTAFLSVALGAFGAHAVKNSISPELLRVYQTAVEYQFFHALGLILLGLIYQQLPQRLVSLSGWLMLAGIVVFSGSLYILSLSGVRWLGAITPIGGMAFLLAWLILVYALIRPAK